jgi:glycosyltransferase involved in cell wall biosynthesis
MLSVVLCTHNPRADYIHRCLCALQNQTLAFHQWELVVVDNRSDELINGRIDLSWHQQAKIKREETLGLTAARLRGIREAKGDLLVFVDDDNVLDPDFLEVALRTMDDRPFLGSWSGQCRPEFEAPPPKWTRRYWGNLVIREFERDVWSNLPRLPESMPCGAGLCVLREVAMRYVDLHESGERPFQFDRNGKSLLSGGDNDLAACACDLGLGVGLIASLKLTHLISPDRLTEEYLARLCEGISCSAVVLDHLRSPGAATNLYKVRWYEPVRASLFRGPHRKMQFASLRGRRRGLELIDSLN